jgi:hypothetical protein
VILPFHSIHDAPLDDLPFAAGAVINFAALGAKNATVANSAGRRILFRPLWLFVLSGSILQNSRAE